MPPEGADQCGASIASRWTLPILRQAGGSLGLAPRLVAKATCGGLSVPTSPEIGGSPAQRQNSKKMLRKGPDRPQSLRKFREAPCCGHKIFQSTVENPTAPLARSSGDPT